MTTYDFPSAYAGDTYAAPDFKLLNISSTALTSGTLTAAQEYLILEYMTSDSFTNVGASENLTGIVFTASGTTPTTWTNESILHLVISRISLVGASIRLQFKKYGKVVKTITSASGITITDDVNGEFKIDDFIPDFCGTFDYDVQVTFSPTLVRTYFKGTFTVSDDITSN